MRLRLPIAKSGFFEHALYLADSYQWTMKLILKRQVCEIGDNVFKGPVGNCAHTGWLKEVSLESTAAAKMMC